MALSWSILIILSTITELCAQLFLKNEFASEYNNFGGGGSSSSYYDDSQQYCLMNFEVSRGSIIRTKDSLAIGAKYLNVSEFGNGRKAGDDCLRLCCKTPHCNVITFEEKKSGSCYMFDCEAEGKFICKFTEQGSYMSAILRKREDDLSVLTRGQLPPPPPPLPPPASQNRHEVELSQLKNEVDTRGSGIPSMETIDEIAGVRIESNKDRHFNNTTSNYKKSVIVMDGSPNNGIGVGTPRCSRNQFECQSTGECIAIYNACDGIPQCPDGSDEALELNCPSSGGSGTIGGHSIISSSPGKKEPSRGALPGTSAGFPGNAYNNGPVPGPQHQPMSMGDVPHPVSKQQELSQFGHGMPYGDQKITNLEAHSVGNGRAVISSNPNIFSHKDGNIIDDSFGPQIQQQRQNVPYWKSQSFDYGTGDMSPNGYGQGQPLYQQQHNSPYFGNFGGNGGSNVVLKYPAYSDIGGNSGPGSNIQIQLPQQLPFYNPPNSINGVKINSDLQTSPNLPNDDSNKGNIIVNTGPIPDKPTTMKPIPVDSVVKSTIPPSTAILPSHVSSKNSAKKYEDQVIQNLLNKAALPLLPLQGFKDEFSETETPGIGAYMAFIAGFAMSILMVLMVTCRLRGIRMSSRRRGKNRLDPDYLVDGMYL